MDPRIDQCPDLTAADIARLRAVEAGMFMAADVSRADLLLCCLAASDRALLLRHVMPASIASLYPAEATGASYNSEEQPLLLRALHGGRSGSEPREIKGSRAPIIQDVHPINNDAGIVIGALVVQTNMFAHERHRRRSYIFRHAVSCMLQMCVRGELECTQHLSRFGPYDGVYLVDHTRTVLYMSGIAANLFRLAGLNVDVEGQRVADLEPLDEEMVDEVLIAGHCLEKRRETPDGRVWVRMALPLCMAAQGLPFFSPARWRRLLRRRKGANIDAALVLLHNATDAVQKQRELNVKSAIIQEVHHRVKNNLQTIAAILRIQARRSESDETRQQLTEAVNRILSVSVIHEFLSEDEHQPINIRDLADRIAGQVNQVAGTPEQEIDIRVHGPSVRLPSGQATPVAMVINELMLNAVEHGLRGYRRGQIDIGLQDLGDRVRVTVENSGSSLPPNFDAQRAGSLGLQIIHTLVTDDLKGTLLLENGGMTSLPAGSPDATDLALGEGGEDIAGEVEPPPAPQPSGTRAVVTFPKRPLKVD